MRKKYHLYLKRRRDNLVLESCVILENEVKNILNTVGELKCMCPELWTVEQFFMGLSHKGIKWNRKTYKKSLTPEEIDLLYPVLKDMYNDDKLISALILVFFDGAHCEGKYEDIEVCRTRRRSLE